MTQVPGLLTQRVRLYTPENIGANGFDKVVYRFTGEWWGRVGERAATENVPQAPQATREYRLQGRAVVADYVPIPLNGVLTEGGDLWWIRGVVKSDQRRQQVVTLERIQPNEFVTLAEPQQSFATGDQLVDSMGSWQ